MTHQETNSSPPKARILVTGATGKVGSAFLQDLFADPRFKHTRVRALCHNRVLDPRERLEVVHGSIADRRVVRRAMEGVTHVLHMATCKETPEDVMDVAVKGLFWLLEECSQAHDFRQFILIGGDAAMGHFYFPHPTPVTEAQKHSAYPGCYALSKVLEEVMLEQYYGQYGLNGCILRAPWIMEKDDFKYTLSFGEDVFGGPRWCDLVGKAKAAAYAKAGTVPVLCDQTGEAIRRNFVHVQDLVSAILAAIDSPRARQQTYNICMDEPVHYRALAEYLRRTRNLPSVDIRTPFVSTWLDNAKAKFHLDWKPEYNLAHLIEAAWSYERAAKDPRKVWYPG